MRLSIDTCVFNYIIRSPCDLPPVKVYVAWSGYGLRAVQSTHVMYMPSKVARRQSRSFCPCVGPIPLVGQTLAWFTWVENSTSHDPRVVNSGYY